MDKKNRSAEIFLEKYFDEKKKQIELLYSLIFLIEKIEKLETKKK